MKKALLTLAVAVSFAGSSFALETGSLEAPLSVDAFLEMNNTTESQPNTYLKGYIVGYIPGMNFSETKFSIGSDVSATNLVLAQSSQEDDYQACVPIQLPSGDIRNALNLQAHPENLGHEIILCGTNVKYFGAPGLKDVSSFQWVGEAPVPSETKVYGSEAAPISVADLLKIDCIGTSQAYVKGYIVGAITEGAQSLDNMVFGTEGVAKTMVLLAPTPTTTNTAECLPIQLPTGEIRDAVNLAENPANLGKLLTVGGSYEKYFGVPGIKTPTYFVLGEGGDVPPVASPVVYKNAFASLEGWEIVNEIDNGLDGWRINSSPVCAIANSYSNGKNLAADSWLISPVIDLAGRTDCTASVDQGYGFYFPTSQDKFCTVNIREAGSTEWTQLTLTVFPEKGTGNWTKFATNEFDIKAFDGKKIQMAFHYINDGNQSVAWELQNFVVKGEPDSAVAAIEATEGEAVYFNLQGVRVANPENGLYIKILNGKATKVVVK